MSSTNRTIEAANLWSLPSPDRWVAIVAAVALAYSCNMILVPVALPVETVRDQGHFYYSMAFNGTIAAMVRILAVFGIAAGTLACRRALTRWSPGGEPGELLKSIAARTGWIILTITSWPLISDLLLDGPFGERGAWWVTAAGWLALCASLVLLFLDRSTSNFRTQVFLTALPFGTWVVVEVLRGEIGDLWVAAVDYRSDPVRQMAGNIEVLLVGYVLWSALEWADVVATAATGLVRRRSSLLPLALVMTKTAWIGAGISGLLPTVLGGHLAVWEGIRGDGWASWVWAGLVAAALLSLVNRVARSSIPAEDVGLKSGIVLVFGLLLVVPGAVAGAWETLRDLLQVIVLHTTLLPLAFCVAGAVVCRVLVRGPSPAASRRVLGLGVVVAASSVAAYATEPRRDYDYPDIPQLVWLGGYYFLVPLAILVTAALVVRIALRRAARIDGRTFTALVFAALALGPALFYSAPRLTQMPLPLDQEFIGATGDLYTVDNADDFVVDRPSAVEKPFNGAGGSFQLATLDAALSVVALCLLATPRVRRNRALSSSLVLMLACFWVLSYSEWLSLPNWRGEIWFYVALIVPVAWQLLVRGHRFNSGLPHARVSSTLGTLGLACVVLAVAGYRSATAEMDPAQPYSDSLFAYAGEFGVRYWLVAFGLVAVVDRVLEVASEPQPSASGQHE